MGQGEFNPSSFSDTAALAAMAAGRTVTSTRTFGGISQTFTVTALEIAEALGAPRSVISQMSQRLTEAGRAQVLLNAVAESMRAGLRVPTFRAPTINVPTIDEYEDISGPRSGPRPQGFDLDDPDDLDVSASGVTGSLTAATVAAITAAIAQGFAIDDDAAGAIAAGIAAGQGISGYTGTVAATFGPTGPIGTTEGNITTGSPLDTGPQAAAPSVDVDV